MKSALRSGLLVTAVIAGTGACTSILGGFDYNGKASGTGGMTAASSTTASGGTTTSTSNIVGSGGMTTSTTGSGGTGGMPCTQTCTMDTDCKGVAVCASAKCSKTGCCALEPAAGPCQLNGGVVCGDLAGGAAGTCVACNVPGDCTPSTTLCGTVTCTGNACGSTSAVVGTACSDSGGTRCDGMGKCVQCNVASDCTGGMGCTLHKCVPSSCSDTMKDGAETDVDCGGPVCGACAPGKACGVQADCTPGYCKMGVCAAASCTDLVKDGTETDVDCGGSCTTKCADGKACAMGGDCLNGACAGGVCVSCMDGKKNGGETDVDCGGPCTAKCADGRQCGVNNDCANANCFGGKCISCMDGVKDGQETGVDCGGALCNATGSTCPFGGGCGTAADCHTGYCNGNVCDAVTLAFGQQSPIGLTIDSNFVYWVDSAAGTVMKVSKSGSGLLQLNGTTSTPRARAIAVDATNVYWVTDDVGGGSGDVWKAPIGGGAGTRLATNQGPVVSVAIDATFVYYTNFDGGVLNGGVVRKVPISGGGAPVVLASGINQANGIAVAQTTLYWTVAGDGTVIAQTGSMQTTIASIGASMPGPIVVSSTWVLWAGRGDGKLYKSSIFGGATNPLASGQGSASGIATDGADLYWTGYSGVGKVPIGGGTVTILYYVVSTLQAGIAVDGTDVYFIDNGTVKKIHK